MWIVLELWLVIAAFTVGIWVYAVPVAAWRKMKAEEQASRQIACRPIQPEVIYRDRPIPIVADDLAALEMLFKHLRPDEDERQRMQYYFSNKELYE